MIGIGFLIASFVIGYFLKDILKIAIFLVIAFTIYTYRWDSIRLIYEQLENLVELIKEVAL